MFSLMIQLISSSCKDHITLQKYRTYKNGSCAKRWWTFWSRNFSEFAFLEVIFVDLIHGIRSVVIYWILFKYWTSLEKQFFSYDELLSVVNRLCEEFKKNWNQEHLATMSIRINWAFEFSYYRINMIRSPWTQFSITE